MALTVKYYITQISDENKEAATLITNESIILSNTGKFVITPVITGSTSSTPVHSHYSYEGSSYEAITSSTNVNKGYGKYTIKTVVGEGDPTYINFYVRSQFTDLSTYEPKIIERNSGKVITKGTEFDKSVLVQFETQLAFDLEIFNVEVDGLKIATSGYDLTGLKTPITEIGSHEVSFYIRNRDNYNTGTLTSKIITVTFVIRNAKLNWKDNSNIPKISLTDIGINCNRVIKDGVEYFTPANNYYGTDLPNVVIDWELPPKIKADYILNFYENVVSPSSKNSSKSQIVGDFERGVTLLNKVGLYELNITLSEEGLTNTFKMPVTSFIIMPNGITLNESGLKCSVNGMVEINNTNRYFMKNETVIPDVYYSHYVDGSVAVDVSERVEIKSSLTKNGEEYPYQNGFTQLNEVGDYVLTATVNEVFNDGDISTPITKTFEFEIKDIPLQLNSMLKELILRDLETNEIVENKTYNKKILKLKAPKTVEEIPILMYVQGPGYNKNTPINENTCNLTEEGSYSIELKIIDPNYDKNTVSKYYEIILYNPENHHGENLCPLNIYINGIMKDMPTGTDSWELPLQDLNILGPCNVVAVNAFALNNAANPENFKYSLSECTFEIVNREYLETPFIYTAKDTKTKWSSTDLFVEYPPSTRLEQCTLEIYKNNDNSPCFLKTGTELNKIYRVNDSNTVKLSLPGAILNGVNENGFSLKKNDTLKIVAYYRTTLLSETLNKNETLVTSTRILENYTPYDPGEIILTGFTNKNDIYYSIIPDVMRLSGCEYTATITSTTLGLKDKVIELGKELFTNKGINKPPINTGKFSLTLTVKVSYTDSLGKKIEKSKSKVFYIDRDLPLNVNFLDSYITKQIYLKNTNIINDLTGQSYNFNINELRVYLNNRRLYPENDASINKNNPLGAFKYIFNPTNDQPGLPPGGYNLMITFKNENNGRVVSYQKWFNVVSTPLNSSQKKPLIPLRGIVNSDGIYTYNTSPENEELVQITNASGETTGQVAVYKEGLTINKMSELNDSVSYFGKEVSLLQSDIALNESKTNAIKPVATDIRNELKSSLIRKSINAEVLINNHYENCDKIVLADVSELINTKIEANQSVSNVRTNGVNLNLLIRKINGRTRDLLNTIESYQNLASATAEVMYTYNNNLVTEKNEEILPSGMSVDIYDRIKALDANGNTNYFTVVPGCKITAKGANETTWVVYDRKNHEIAKQGRSTEFTFTVNENLEDSSIKIKAIDLADPNGKGKYKLLSLIMTY